MKRTYGAIYYHVDGWWYATSEEVDVLTQGKTLDEARAMLADIIRSTIGLRRDTISTDAATAEVIREEITVEVPTVLVETT